MRLRLARNPLPLAFLAMLLHGELVDAAPRTDYLRADETVPVAMLSGAVDAWTALDLLERREARELNPLAQTPAKLVAVQFASVGGHVLASHLIDRRYGRKWGKRTLYGIAVLKFGIAAYQLKAARAK